MVAEAAESIVVTPCHRWPTFHSLLFTTEHSPHHTCHLLQYPTSEYLFTSPQAHPGLVSAAMQSTPPPPAHSSAPYPISVHSLGRGAWQASSGWIGPRAPVDSRRGRGIEWVCYCTSVTSWIQPWEQLMTNTKSWIHHSWRSSAL